MTSGQEQVPQKIALSCLEKCPPAILTIFRRVLSILNLSDKDLSPIPARALSREEIRLNALLTGLFPGEAAHNRVSLGQLICTCCSGKMICFCDGLTIFALNV